MCVTKGKDLEYVNISWSHESVLEICEQNMVTLTKAIP